MAKADYAEFGTWLREERIKKGFTQLEVANVLGYTNAQFVSNAERGLCRLPFEAISKLVKLYGLDPENVIEHLVRQHYEYYREVFKKDLAAAKRGKKAKSR